MLALFAATLLVAAAVHVGTPPTYFADLTAYLAQPTPWALEISVTVNTMLLLVLTASRLVKELAAASAEAASHKEILRTSLDLASRKLEDRLRQSKARTVELSAAYHELEQVAYFDALTGVCSLLGLERAFRQRVRTDEPAALVIIDVRDFTDLNAHQGFEAGDAALYAIAGALEDFMTGRGVVARYAGDRFVLLFNRRGTTVAALNAVREALAHLRATRMTVEGAAFRFSCGCALFPEHGATFSDLLRRAEIALLRCKRRRGDDPILFSDQYDATGLGRYAEAAEIWRGVENQEFVLHYQPIVDLRSGQVTSVEALVRWYRDGTLHKLPGEFVDLAISAGAMDEIAPALFRDALTMLLHWSEPPFADIRVAVNVSSAAIISAEHREALKALVTGSGVSPSRLILEVTESEHADIEALQEAARDLSDFGAAIALDDFGAGLSNLDRFSRLRADFVKIDRDFVTPVATSARARALLNHIVSMATNTGISVIAEGVETTAQRDAVAEAGCGYAQGFHFARPMPRRALEDFILGAARVA